MRSENWMTFRRAASLAVLAATLGTPTAILAAAPAAPADTAAPDDTIIVSARRRDETLQSVPLAITAISGEGLVRAGVRDLHDISFLSPGVIINPGTGETSSSPTIRGLAFTPQNGDQTVATFFDNAFIGGSSANSIALIDLERVEIVKGPVNSLYGRAAYAGAINYISRKPGNVFTLDATGMIGNDGQRKIMGAVGIPIIKDILAIRVAGNYETYDGGYKDPVNGLRAGNFKKRDGQMSLSFTPGSNFSTDARIYYGNDDFGPGALNYTDSNCGTTNTYAGVTRFNFLCGKYNEKQHPVEVAPEAVSFKANARKIINTYMRNRFSAEAFEVTSLTTYTKITQRRFTDFFGYRNGIPFVIVSCPVGQTTCNNLSGPGTPNGTVQGLYMNFGSDANDRDFSQELRFSAKADSRLRWSFGGYYASVKTKDSTLIGLNSNKLLPGTTIQGGAATATSYNYDRIFLAPGGTISNAVTLAFTQQKLWSGFAGTDFDVTDKLTITGEARYASDKRSLDSQRSNLFLFPQFRPFGGPFTETFKNWTGRASAQYKFTPDINLYATYATGVKAGGFNQRATRADDLAFGPEKNKTYEVGLKTNLFNRMVQFNVSAFYVDIKGLQISGPANDPANAGLVTKNLGGARSKGLEFEAAVRPFPGLRINGGGSFIISKFKDGTNSFSDVALCTQVGAAYCDPSRIVRVVTPAAPGGVSALNLGGLYIPNQSKWTATLEANYETAVTDDIKGFFNAQYRYQSKEYGEQTNAWWYGPLNRVNARIGASYKSVTGTLFVDNLTKNTTPDRAYRSTILNNFATVYNAAMPYPRRYGITVAYKY